MNQKVKFLAHKLLKEEVTTNLSSADIGNFFIS